MLFWNSKEQDLQKIQYGSVCATTVLSINQTYCIIKQKTISLFFSTATVTVELNSCEKGKNKMPKQCFSIIMTQKVICCCFRTWPTVSVFSLYHPLEISLNNFIPTFFSSFFPLLWKKILRKQQLPKEKQQGPSRRTVLAQFRLPRNWKLCSPQADHARSPRRLAALSMWPGK